MWESRGHVVPCLQGPHDLPGSETQNKGKALVTWRVKFSAQTGDAAVSEGVSSRDKASRGGFLEEAPCSRPWKPGSGAPWVPGSRA